MADLSVQALRDWLKQFPDDTIIAARDWTGRIEPYDLDDLSGLYGSPGDVPRFLILVPPYSPFPEENDE